MLAMPLLSRLYSASEFGYLTIFTSIASIGAIVFTLRFETGIVQASVEDAPRLVGLCLGLICLLGGIALVMVGLAAFLVPAWFGAFSREILLLSLVGSVLTAVIGALTNWAIRNTSYGTVARARTGQSAFSLAVAIILAGFASKVGLIVGQIAGMTAAILVLRPHTLARFGIELSTSRPVIKRNISAPLYLFPAGLLDVLTQQLPVLLIATWFSSQMAGQFGLAWRVLLFPVSLISAAAGQVFFQRASRIWPAQDELRLFMLATWKLLACLSFLPTSMVMLFGPVIFATVFGADWKEAGAIAQVLSPMAFAMFVSSPTSAVVLLLGMQKTSLKFGIAFLCYRVASIYIAVAAGDLRLGLLVWVLCELFAIVVYNVLMLQRMKRT